MRRVLALLLPSLLAAVAGLALAACSNDASQPFPVPPTEDLAATVRSGGPTRVPPATTPPSLLPNIDATPRSSAGRVRASLTGDCVQTDRGTELRVSFSAAAEGGNLSRVRLFAGDEVLFDSGEIDRAELARSATFLVESGSQHVFRIVAESGGTRSSVGTLIVCPQAPAEEPNSS